MGNVARFVNVFDTSSSVTKIWKDISKNSKYPLLIVKDILLL